MIKGLLWFENDPRISLPDKVKHAAEYYFRKFGRHATCCYIHPKNGIAESALLDIRVIPSPTVQPNYFFVGEEPGMSGN